MEQNTTAANGTTIKNDPANTQTAADTQTGPAVQKRTVLDEDDIAGMIPALGRHRRLVKKLLHWLYVDRVNAVHSKHFDTPGQPFTHALLKDFDITLKIDNSQVLDNLPQGAFITVSNHPFGALDGISLIDIVASRRPDYKVMVNMVLGHITAMRPNFIAVDALASTDPAKKAVSMRGIKEAIDQVKGGHGLGFFPAGAVSKVQPGLRIRDRQWQPSVIRLIDKLKVPVIPIYFHGHNSTLFNLVGIISWQARTLLLPREVWRRNHKTIHISVGDPISVDQQRRHAGSIEELGRFLKQRTYDLARKNG